MKFKPKQIFQSYEEFMNEVRPGVPLMYKDKMCEGWVNNRGKMITRIEKGGPKLLNSPKYAIRSQLLKPNNSLLDDAFRTGKIKLRNGEVPKTCKILTKYLKNGIQVPQPY